MLRYVTRTNVSFFDPSPNLVVRSKQGAYIDKRPAFYTRALDQRTEHSCA